MVAVAVAVAAESFGIRRGRMAVAVRSRVAAAVVHILVAVRNPHHIPSAVAVAAVVGYYFPASYTC